MTVEDLISELRLFPPDMEVRYHGGDYGAREIEEVKRVFANPPAKYLWTYATELEAVDMAEIVDGNLPTTYALALIR